MKKILVLGCNSFAGAAFTDACLKKDFQVVGINRSEPTSKIFQPFLENSNIKNFTFIQANLNTDHEMILAAMDSFQPQYIVDFAGQGMVAESWDQPQQWYQTNIVSKSIIHRHLLDVNYLEFYLRISTPEVYGSSNNLIKETDSMNPSTPYAVSHMATDLSIQNFHNNFSFPILIGRFANFYGPHQQLYRIIPITISSILSGKKMNLHGGGASIRAFIHSEDVNNGIFKMISRGVSGEVYHFSPQDFISIKDLVMKICHQMDAKFEKVVKVSDDRVGKDFAYLMDSSKARDKLQWEPEVQLEHGISSTIVWMTENYDKIKLLPSHYIHKE